MTLTNRSAGGCCEQWQTSLTHTRRGRKMCALIRPRAIIILARVGPGTSYHLSRPTPASQSTTDARLAPCARDVWGADHSGDLVWAIHDLAVCSLPSARW